MRYAEGGCATQDVLRRRRMRYEGCATPQADALRRMRYAAGGCATKDALRRRRMRYAAGGCASEAIRITSSSLNIAPCNCMPTGMPEVSVPAGKDRAGMPAMLALTVK
jgi:hypothetical protein